MEYWFVNKDNKTRILRENRCLSQQNQDSLISITKISIKWNAKNLLYRKSHLSERNAKRSLWVSSSACLSSIRSASIMLASPQSTWNRTHSKKKEHICIKLQTNVSKLSELNLIVTTKYIISMYEKINKSTALCGYSIRIFSWSPNNSIFKLLFWQAK